MQQFQKYLIYNHSAGIGKPAPIEYIRGATTCRINFKHTVTPAAVFAVLQGHPLDRSEGFLLKRKAALNVLLYNDHNKMKKLVKPCEILGAVETEVGSLEK